MQQATTWQKKAARRWLESLSIASIPPLYHQLKGIRDTYPKQYDVIMDEATHVLFAGGVGASKTWVGAFRATRALLGWVGNKQIPTPNTGIVTAPTWDMVKDAAQIAFREIAAPFIKKDSADRTVMVNGSVVLWRTVSDAAMENRRGPSVSWWWADEAAMYNPMVRKIMLARLRQKGHRGYNWATTTPKGRNWLYQIYIDPPKPLSDDWSIHSAKTKENPYLDQEYYEMLALEYYGDHARQELDAEFVSFAGLVYSDFAPERHVMVAADLPSRDAFKQVIAGVDWGLVNAGCILVIGIDGDDRAYVLEERYERGKTIDEWANHAEYLNEKWNIETFYCDPSDKTARAKFNERVGITAYKARNEVNPGIRQVEKRLPIIHGKPRLIISSNCINLIQEMKQYQWQTAPDGEPRELVVKSNDHAVDALRYALFTGVDRKTQFAFSRNGGGSTRYI